MANTSNNDTIYASDLAFRPTVSNKGDISTVFNRAAINQSIFNIIYTKKGSRIGNPDFGVGLHNYLFEPMVEETANNIGRAIVSQLILWEPRIEVIKTDIKVLLDPQAGYEISINYIINSTLSNGDFTMFLPKGI